jgi:hypothetical protein
MTILFFLKPIWNRVIRRGAPSSRPAASKPKKKKVYKVEYYKKTPTAVEVDWRKYSAALFRVDKEKRAKQEAEDLTFLAAILEGAL